MVENCGSCNSGILSGDFISCGGICSRKFHTHCVNLSEASLQLIKTSEGVCFKCKVCNGMPLLGLLTKLSLLTNELKSVRSDIRELKNNISNKTGDMQSNNMPVETVTVTANTPVPVDNMNASDIPGNATGGNENRKALDLIDSNKIHHKALLLEFKFFNYSNQGFNNVAALVYTFAKANFVALTEYINSFDWDALLENSNLKGCGAGEIDTSKYAAAVAYIKDENFKNFKFIVIAILDDSNDDERHFTASNGDMIELYSDVLQAVYENNSLHKKLCLFLLQINRDYSNCPPNRNHAKGVLTHDFVMYFATSTGCYLNRNAWNREGASPFISILCEEIRKNAFLRRPVIPMLNCVTDRMNAETDEFPSLLKNINVDSYCIPQQPERMEYSPTFEKSSSN